MMFHSSVYREEIKKRSVIVLCTEIIAHIEQKVLFHKALTLKASTPRLHYYYTIGICRQIIACIMATKNIACIDTNIKRKNHPHVECTALAGGVGQLGPGLVMGYSIIPKPE